MNDNRQYLMVGVFVVLATTILVGVWLWFSASNLKVYNVYQTVFSEPVDGISINSVIKYNGVEVGKVKSVQLDKSNPRNVQVYLNVLQEVPINIDTYAIMKSQGVTGMSYIDLRLPKTSTSTTILKPHNKEPYPLIPAHPSFLYSLTEQAQSLTDNVKDIGNSVKFLLDDEHIEHLANILKNLDKTSETIANHSDSIGKSLDSLLVVLDNVKNNSVQLNQTFADLSVLTKSLSKTSENTNNLIMGVQNNTMQNVNSVLLPNLNQAVIHMNQSSYQLEQLLTLLNENPSALVRGKVPAPKGPGE